MCSADRLDLGGRRVLVVEDEVVIALDLAATLERRGAVVLGPAATVAEAIELLADGRGVDCAVLDIVLKDALVFPLADILREMGASYVFVTGRDDAIIPSEHSHVPRHEKPLDLDAVADALLLAPAAAPARAADRPGPEAAGRGAREQR